MRRSHSERVLRALIREFNLFGGSSQPSLNLFGSEGGFLNLFGGRSTDTSSGPAPFDTSVHGMRTPDGQLIAAVIGDSQSGGALGTTIERRLKDMGFDSVTRTHRNGATGDQVVDEQAPAAFAGSDLVVAIFGGNDPSVASALAAAEDLYNMAGQSGSYLVVIGPPPATMITNTRLAGEVFGGVLGDDPAPDAQLRRQGGDYARQREEIAQALEDGMAGRPGVSAVGIAGNIDVEDQPDGLHLVVGVDRIVDEIFTRLNMSGIVESLKATADVGSQSTWSGSQMLDTGQVATAEDIAAAYPEMRSYADLIVTVSEEIGIRPNWLANVINFESGGNPRARNKYSDATGLIQFMPSTARSHGTTVDQLREMSGREQMEYVRSYFMKHKGRLNSQEDVYMAVFYPVAIGKPDFRFPPEVPGSNPGIYTPRDYVEKANRRAKLA